MIGSDESLKGDTFGGIVIAAVQTTPELDTELARLGITDSKKIQDKYIPQLARLIKSKCPHAIVEYYPVEYNQHTLTQLLNDSHKAVAQQVREKLQEHNQANLSHLHKELHIVDLYPGCTVGDIRETKAESKYVCVAAASILARDVAL
jgi:ribonuclease HIII